jgi:hypothetical protein
MFIKGEVLRISHTRCLAPMTAMSAMTAMTAILESPSLPTKFHVVFKFRDGAACIYAAVAKLPIFAARPKVVGGVFQERLHGRGRKAGLLLESQGRCSTDEGCSQRCTG